MFTFYRMLFVSAVVLLCSCATREEMATPDPGWSVRRNGTGLAVSWDRSSAQLRNYREVTLAVRDGSANFAQPLTNQAGTLFLSPQTEDVVISLRVDPPPKDANRDILIYGRDRAVAPAPETPVTQPAPAPEASRSRAGVSSASNVDVLVIRAGEPTLLRQTVARLAPLPAIPPSLKRRLGRRVVKVGVFVKINEFGKVASASTVSYRDPVQKQLADLAVRTAFRWSFDPVLVNNRAVYADAKLEFQFPPKKA